METTESQSVCVVIPVHKAVPAADEVTSLQACAQRLKAYDRFLVFPVGIDVRAYIAIDPELKLKPVDPQWLASIEQYNKMKVSEAFYQLFSSYQFMMTYEPDAYIFTDKLEVNNAFAFDYIGAPFFEGYWAAKPGARFIEGCNSGFSVRNIQSCLKALRSMRKYRMHWLLYKAFLSPVRAVKIKVNEWTKGKYEVFVTGRFAFYFEDFHLNEDVIWGDVIPKLFPWFRVADPMSALKFSFEYNLDESLRLNGGKLPLGCHAWAKHPEFWNQYINATENISNAADEV